MGLTHVTSMRCDIELPVNPRFAEPDKLALEVIRRHNAQRGSQSCQMAPQDLLKDFAEMTESERQAAKGGVIGQLDGGARCEALDVPLYPKNRMAFQEWAAWRSLGLFCRHMTREQAESLVIKASEGVPGHREHGPLKMDVVRGTLSPKQLSYLSSADCWPPLPR
jgi:hypothetical protein